MRAKQAGLPEVRRFPDGSGLVINIDRPGYSEWRIARGATLADVFRRTGPDADLLLITTFCSWSTEDKNRKAFQRLWRTCAPSWVRERLQLTGWSGTGRTARSSSGRSL